MMDVLDNFFSDEACFCPIRLGEYLKLSTREFGETNLHLDFFFFFFEKTVNGESY